MAISLRQVLQSLGGGLKVGDTVERDDIRELVTLQNGDVLLKEDVTITDVVNYPDTPIKFSRNEDAFDLVGGANFAAIEIGGGFLWTLDDSNVIRRYNLDGTFSGVTFTLQGAGTSVAGLTYLNDNLFVLYFLSSGNYGVRVYNNNSGTVIGSFDLTGSTTSTITNNGTNLILINGPVLGDESLKEYTTTGVEVSSTELDFLSDSSKPRKLKYDPSDNLLIATNSNSNLGDSVLYFINPATGKLAFKEGYSSFNIGTVDFAFADDFSFLWGIDFASLGQSVRVTKQIPSIYLGISPSSGSNPSLDTINKYLKIR